MPLGLCMFDAQERLLVCNRRYAEMYDLPSELTRPGTVHCALWDYRTKQVRATRAAASHSIANRRVRSVVFPRDDHRVRHASASSR